MINFLMLNRVCYKPIYVSICFVYPTKIGIRCSACLLTAHFLKERMDFVFFFTILSQLYLCWAFQLTLSLELIKIGT